MAPVIPSFVSSIDISTLASYPLGEEFFQECCSADRGKPSLDTLCLECYGYYKILKL